MSSLPLNQSPWHLSLQQGSLSAFPALCEYTSPNPEHLLILWTKEDLGTLAVCGSPVAPRLVPTFPQSCPGPMPGSLGNMLGTSGWVPFGAPLMAGGGWVAGNLGQETKWCRLPLKCTPSHSVELGRSVAFSTPTLSNVVSSYGNPGDSFHSRVLFQMEC